MKIEKALKEFLVEIEVRKYTPKTIRGYRNNLNLFLRFLQEEQQIQEIEDLTLAAVRQFTLYMSSKGRKGTYINGLLKTAKSFIQYCFDEGYGGFNTKKNFKWCKEDKPVITAFKASDVRQMLQNCAGYDFISIRDKAILTALFETGIRCWELCCIQKSDIHEDFIIINGKNHKQRVVPITAILRKALMKYETVKENYFTLKNIDD
jgi:integrase/recombinase XerD